MRTFAGFATVPALALAAALIAAQVVPAAAAPDVAALRAKVIAAYGGDALRAVHGFRARGRILQVATGVGGRVDLSVELNGSLRTEMRYPGRTEVRILHGPLAWSGGPGRQPLASRDMADAVRLQYHRLAAPYELADVPIEELTAEGETEEGWVRLARRWDDRTRTIYEVDPDSGRIRRIHGELTDADGKVLHFDSEAHDFRKVSGVLFPFRTTTMVNGEITAEVVFERVNLVDDFEASEFRPSDAAGDI